MGFSLASVLLVPSECPPSRDSGHQLAHGLLLLIATGFSGQKDGASLIPASPQVTATDADSGPFGLLSYSLGAGLGASGSPPFRIDAHSGDVCTTRTLDRDQGPSSFDFTVTAVDGVSGQTMGRWGHWDRAFIRAR